MINKNFFSRKKEFFTLAQVLEITGSKLPENSNYDLNKKIYDVATIENANENEISFFHSATYLEKFLDSKAGFCFMEEKSVSKAPKTMIAIVNANPYFAYGKFLSQFYNDKKHYDLAEKISSQAVIAKSAIIGEGSIIKAGAIIGENVKIGNNCFIGANCVIGDDCQIGHATVINAVVAISHCLIGDNVIIHNGAKIGQDGFGFAYNDGQLQKILQLGIVEIGDFAEIGAGTCIDRGAIGNTVIGKQVKIDNMVQIGHNVIIGEGTVIAGCAAIAGSTKIGKFVQIGGSANIVGHIEIGDGAKIAGASGVGKSIAPMQSVGGIPAMPIKDWHRMNIKLLQMFKKSN
ncbi:MAG: UDP-3-O-(3-hydroxymyristoyl)glucosamine N-acyltransferase [Pseudomonadota bacterium]